MALQRPVTGTTYQEALNLYQTQRIVDMANRGFDEGRRRTFPRNTSMFQDFREVVKIYCSAASGFNAGEGVPLYGPSFDTATAKRNDPFQNPLASNENTRNGRQWGLAVQAQRAYAYGYVQTRGHALAQVYDVDDVLDLYVNTVGYDANVSAYPMADPAGSAEVIWAASTKDDTSHLRWCWLNLGPPQQRTSLGVALRDILADEADSSDNVTIHRGDGTATPVTVNAKLDWMHGDQQISLGKEVLVMYFPYDELWRIIGAECEDSGQRAVGSTGLQVAGGIQTLDATWSPPDGMDTTFAQGAVVPGATPNSLEVTKAGTYRVGAHFSLNVQQQNTDVSIRAGNNSTEGWHQVNYHEKTADNGLAGSSERFITVTQVPTDVAFEIIGNGDVEWETCALIVEEV